MDASVPSLALQRGDEPAIDALPVRDVTWVLRWAVVAAAIVFGILILTTFAFQLSTERALVRAAEAGLREASLPRATARSIEDVVRRRLAVTKGLDRATSVVIRADSIALTVPLSAVLPQWMAILGADGATIECERTSLPARRTRKLRRP